MIDDKPLDLSVPREQPFFEGHELLNKHHALQGLTAQQEMFCKLIFTGMPQVDAYRRAYRVEHATSETVSHMAKRAAKTPRVVARLNQLHAAWQQRASLDGLIRRDEIARGIASIAFNEAVKPGDRLRAYEMLGKIGGIDLFKPGDGGAKPEDLSLDQVEQLLLAKLKALKTVSPT